MQSEHLDPQAVKAHLELGAVRSFGVHGATFQLGDEAPFQPALDLARSTLAGAVHGFDVVPVGTVVDVPPAAAPLRREIERFK
jgi:N-acyl-phosphatidylethanolamine-hydrolysing phospholipase D